jgi:hypothetical protein
MESTNRGELFEEYYRLAAIVQNYDQHCLTVKAWGVTASGAAMGVAFSRERPIAVLVVALALSIAFWLTEVRFKLFQLSHMLRIAELETALQNDQPLTSPRIFGAFGEESIKNLRAGRWRSVIFWPQVMLPHMVFAGLSLVFIIAELARQSGIRIHW